MPRRTKTPREALARLFAELLDVGEIRRLVAYSAEGLDHDLVGGSRTELADAAADLLLRRGLVDDALFDRLLLAAPGRGEDIRRVQAQLAPAAPPASSPPAPAADPAPSRPAPELAPVPSARPATTTRRAGHSLRILHLSDLHERVALGWMEPARKRTIRYQAAGRLRVVGDPLIEVLRGLPPVDLVVFTGDLADWGLPEEYERAQFRLKAILDAVGLSWERFFPIPGNHDVCRKERGEDWEKLRSLAGSDLELLSQWMADLPVPVHLKDEPWREAVPARMAGWRAFLAAVRPDLLAEHHAHGRLGYRATPELGLPFPVHLVGLDSAWLCGDNADAGRIALTGGQRMNLHDDEGAALPGLRVALMHHPPAALLDRADVLRQLADSTDVLLHGHIHDPIAQDVVDPDHRLRVLAAGSLYEGDHGDKWINGFQVVTLHTNDHGHPVHLELDLWGWSPRGHWHPDGSVYRAARDGHLEWSWDGASWGKPDRKVESRRQRHAARLKARILELERRRDTAPSAILDDQILTLRRELRAGPLLQPGEVLAHRWVLGEPIGSGGYATVWRGQDRQGGQAVAVKVLKGELAMDESKRDRFHRGARIMRDLADLGVVCVHEDGVDDSFHYVVMDCLTGGDLAGAVLAGLEPNAALDHVLAVGRILAAARERMPTLLHRDVKPANILLSDTGTAHLTDFDLGVHDASTGGTTGHLGTWLYAAPEQMARASEADERADVYGLAMTAVFCLHGQDLPMDVIRDAPAFARGLDTTPPVREVLARGVAWDREDRPATVAAFCEALEAARREPVPAPAPPEASPPARRRPRSRPPTTEADSPASLPQVRELLQAVEYRHMKREEARRGLAALATPRTDLAGLQFVAAALMATGSERELRELIVRAGGPSAVGVSTEPWARIPAGSFLMGSAEGEPESFGDERPQHRVRVLSGFSMLTTPVTQALYLAVMGENPSHFRNDLRHPVESVSARQAEVFCARLSELLGWKARLPREEEWEYACRAGTTGPRYDSLEEAAWFRDNSGGKSHPVGEKYPNDWGLYDMLGNVWEWTASPWTSDHAEAADTVDPVEDPADLGGAVRVVRGGSWRSNPRWCRSAYRSRRHPDDRDVGVGFRVVLPPAPSRH
jgi:formylglycine-generating enzyme required for sulfatase activity/predicted MPP superfamily phosphohydrolase